IVVWPIFRRPRDSAVAMCFSRRPFRLLTSVIFKLAMLIASLTNDFFYALAPDSGNLLRTAEGLQALHGGLDHILGVVGAQAFGADVPDAHRLHHGADSAAGDDAGAFRRGLQQNGAGAEDADDLMGDGGAGQGDFHHVLLGVRNALENGLRDLGGLSQAVADGALAVAHNDQSGELHDAAALDGLADPV